MQTRRTLKSSSFMPNNVIWKHAIKKRPAALAAVAMISFLSGVPAHAVTKANAAKQLLAQTQVNRIVITSDGRQLFNPPELQTSVACLSRHDKGTVWAVASWIVGNELYKSYQDPTAACGGFYPYTITDAHMFLQISASATIAVALDIEKIDTVFIPGCPVPGDMIHLGDLTTITFPAPGLYEVSLQLSQPVVVNGPFFLGFFFGSSVSAAWQLALITDNVRVPCVSYNIWDTTIGYVDLGDPESVHQAIYAEWDACYNAPADVGCFEFDGRIVLHTSGILADAAACCVTAGDANHDTKINIADILHIIAFLFTGGPASVCADEADANGDNKVNISDVTKLVSFLFHGSLAPVCGSTGI